MFVHLKRLQVKSLIILNTKCQLVNSELKDGLKKESCSMENGGHKKSFCLHPLSLFPLNFDNNTDIARTNF